MDACVIKSKSEKRDALLKATEEGFFGVGLELKKQELLFSELGGIKGVLVRFAEYGEIVGIADKLDIGVVEGAVEGVEVEIGKKGRKGEAEGKAARKSVWAVL